MISKRALLLVALLAGGPWLVSCSPRPKAPVLSDAPIYDNPLIGLRFDVPENWQQSARSDHLRDTGVKDQLLVRYQAPPGERGVFEVITRLAPADADVAAMLRAASHSARAWTDAGAPEPVPLGGVEAMRYRLTSGSRVKESVAVRRDGRVIFLTVVAPNNETRSFDMARRIVQSATWSR